MSVEQGKAQGRLELAGQIEWGEKRERERENTFLLKPRGGGTQRPENTNIGSSELPPGSDTREVTC